MMDAPVFSIITITYNAEQTLERTIRSVQSQTYPHIEYILVDGASKDGTMELAGHYRSLFAKVVTEPDKGLYDAMNKGMRLATGDYLCFLNAGDRFHASDTLERVVQGLEGYSELPDVLYGQTDLVDFSGNYLRPRHYLAPEKLDWKSFSRGMLVCHQAFWVKRTLAEPYDLQYRFSADYDWCIRILKKGDFFWNTHLTLIDYLEEGVTTQNHKASLMERFRIMIRWYGWWVTAMAHLRMVARAFSGSAG